MGKRIALHVVAVVVGTVAGMILMTGLHMTSNLLYPPPAGLDPMSADPAQQDALKAWMSTLPAGAFVHATLAHGLGCMAGAAIASLIAGRRSLTAALVTGVLFTIAGVLNLSAIPHPSWFAFVDLPIYLLLAFAAGKLLVRPAAQTALT